MKRVVFAGTVVLCSVVAIVEGATCNVPAEYSSIQAGIEAAQDGDVVLVAPGVYYETINFSGKAITVTSKDPNDRAVVGYTVINADQEGSAVTFENGETPASVLTGFTITGGFGTLNSAFEGGNTIFWGGGIYCYQASPTITKNIIAGNRAPVVLANTEAESLLGYGGGIACIESNAVITHNVIRNNVSFIAGGLIVYIGQATVTNNLIYSNSAYLGGGAVLTSGVLVNNTIVGNDAGQQPGGGYAGNAYIMFEPSLGGAVVANNILCGATSGGGLVLEGDPANGVFACNNVWNNVSGNYLLEGGSVLDGGADDPTGRNGNISADPKFLSAAFSKDYHIVFGSPCIDAGDPDYAVLAGATDIDNNARVYARRIDIGADEYVGYVKPVSSAGDDRHVLEPLVPVTLDASQSFFYDPCGVKVFRWTQVSGPSVTLDDPNAGSPTFTPEAFGEYVFELVVGDGEYDGQPDQVLVLVAANAGPVADAGSDRVWGLSAQARLDGSASYDPDVVDRLVYQWTQVEGPAVDLKDADTVAASFFVETEGQYVFELVVSDGFEQSEPSRVRCVAVPVRSAGQGIDATPGSLSGPYQPDVSGRKIVYAAQSETNLQIVYKDMTSGRLDTVVTGTYAVGPKIDGDLVVWFGGIAYAEMSGPVCSSVFVRNTATGVQRTLGTRSDTRSFSYPAVSGNKAVWVQHLDIDKNASANWYNTPYDICGADLANLGSPVFFTIATHVGRRDPFPISSPYGILDRVVDICGDLVVWEAQGDIYAADLSDLNHIRVVTVCDDPARQYGPSIWGRLVVWTDQRNDKGDIYGADLSDLANVREFAVAKGSGTQQQATIDGPLVAYADGSTLGSGIRLACVTRRYGVLSIDLPTSLTGVMPALDGTTLVWLYSTYGPIQAMALDLGYSVFDGRVQNVRTGDRYDYLQHAVAFAEDGDEIVAPAGRYDERVDFLGKPITIRSTDPDDPGVVAATILRSPGGTVVFAGHENANSVLAGFTVTGGNEGVYCYDASPTIACCTMVGSNGAGLRLAGQCNPTVTGCRVMANGAAGIEMSSVGEGRAARQPEATIRNCLIAANGGQGVRGSKPTIVNCTIVENSAQGIDATSPNVANSIVYFNNLPSGDQIKSNRATVAYSDVQGGWTGDGNLDADPLFVSLGTWAGDVWTPGDYHLQSQGWRWDGGRISWVSDEVTSPCIDAGDPASDLLDEPVLTPWGDAADNARIDMGVFGGTAEASLAPGDS
ncbi:MAG TPA: right-handed parallel beta-helix repeat-containing protein [Sedimentisphaerales bacterium]|jgi:beta propeller repeat protein|nr:right-handed parallel beta-helix repeat-containing protein [Sedimentisphaerales bacterium]HNU31087.1 right-handed parallel beta-helix repeat-containing protein [Sedimentisphaerales bacterium]